MAQRLGICKVDRRRTTNAWELAIFRACQLDSALRPASESRSRKNGKFLIDNGV